MNKSFAIVIFFITLIALYHNIFFVPTVFAACKKENDTCANNNECGKDLTCQQASHICFGDCKFCTQDTGKNQNPSCAGSGSSSSSGGGQGDGTGNNANNINPPCATALKDGICPLVSTGIGDISTDASKFIGHIFGILIGVAGGAAVIIIMMAGYKFMTSQGNPDAVKAAREQLVAAIVGLLFLIFSFVILQVLGVDILQIGTTQQQAPPQKGELP